jgi:pimeloyl-ACP methyl ester carboxylesterase
MLAGSHSLPGMPYVEGAGVSLHYLLHGEGPAVVLVHGMGSDALAWESTSVALAEAGLRAIALDRRGYGASGSPEPYAATTVQEQAEDVAALVRALGAAPALLVGDGFGALVVLELLVRRPDLARAAVLADLPLHAFVPAATPALADERSLLEAALREGGRAAAVRAWLGDGARPARADRAAAAATGFFADYAGQSSWSPSRGELRAIGVPVALVTGPCTAPHVVAAADAMARLVPGARRADDGDVVAAVLALGAPGPATG